MNPPSRFLFSLAAALIVITGVFVRLYPSATFRRAGFDEVLYRAYVNGIDAVGLLSYPDLATHYVETQRQPKATAELPPTRFLYIFAGWAWKKMEFGAAPPVDLHTPGAYEVDPALVSLRHVSACFSILLMLLSGLAAWRWGGRGAGLGVLALMAAAPLQIHTSQHALIDGFFAFWAALCLWLLWENLQQPNRRGWLVALAVSLALLVLTKENAFFVYVGLAGLTVVNRWAKFGTVTKGLIFAGIGGPLVGLVILINVAGGPVNFIETYRLLVTKAEHLDYAILTGDGPWFRYLVDLLLMSPVILCLAIGSVFCIARENRAWLFLILFIAFTYLVMCNVRYGMNLRYATIWDLPLRMLVYAQVCWIVARLPAYRQSILICAIAALCAYDVHQYSLFFVQNGLYELATGGLLLSLKIFKESIQ